MLGFSRDLLAELEVARRRLEPQRDEGLTVEANDTGWTLHADVPGVSAEALELTVLGRELQLFVEADTKLPEGFQLRRQERQPSRIERTIRLPNTVDTDALQARLVDGVLQITLPRRAEDAPRRITVHS